jgi:serine/threonine-protein kinase
MNDPETEVPAPPAGEAAAPPRDPYEGTRVGNCWIVHKLGEGGFGTVYRAIDENDRHPVAIKIVKPDRAKNEEAVRKFLRGAIAAAGLEHPNVVRIHRIGRDERHGLHYIVMEHLRGRTLQSLLDERGPLHWRDVIPWVLQAADGLEAAHGRQVLHRDVKPDNLMVTLDGTVKITDLGLARLMTKDARTTRVMGTAHFMAPEQFEGKGMDRRTDVYGLGMTMYYLLSRQFPYEGKNSLQIVFAMLTTRPKPLPEVAPSVPADLWRIVETMIARVQSERYGSMAEVKQALREFLDRHPPAGALVPGSPESAPTP